MQLIKSHKRVINFFKILSLIGILIIIFIIYSLFQTKLINLNVPSQEKNSTVENVSPKSSENYEITILNTIFKGESKDFEPYTINANKAVKISENEFNLEKIQACYNLQNDKLLITAAQGFIDNLSSFINFKDDVQIFFDQLILNTQSLNLNLLNKEAYSKSNVEIFYKNSKINADCFVYKDNINIINFKGNVKTQLNLSDF